MRSLRTTGRSSCGADDCTIGIGTVAEVQSTAGGMAVAYFDLVPLFTSVTASPYELKRVAHCR
jgi:hypothetical protein